jgi:hypothetical protein
MAPQLCALLTTIHRTLPTQGSGAARSPTATVPAGALSRAGAINKTEPRRSPRGARRGASAAGAPRRTPPAPLGPSAVTPKHDEAPVCAGARVQRVCACVCACMLAAPPPNTRTQPGPAPQRTCPSSSFRSIDCTRSGKAEVRPAPPPASGGAWNTSSRSASMNSFWKERARRTDTYRDTGMKLALSRKYVKNVCAAKPRGRRGG